MVWICSLLRGLDLYNCVLRLAHCQPYEASHAVGMKARCCKTPQDFKFGTVFRACVISYETVRKFSKDLKGNCDILICDEGHR